jgi:hypothetical protein
LTRKLNSPARNPSSAAIAIATAISRSLTSNWHPFVRASLGGGPLPSEAFLYRCVDAVRRIAFTYGDVKKSTSAVAGV